MSSELPKPNIVGWTDGIACCTLGCAHTFCETTICYPCVLSRQHEMITRDEDNCDPTCALCSFFFFPIAAACVHRQAAVMAVAPRCSACAYGLFCPFCSMCKTDSELAARDALPSYVCAATFTPWRLPEDYVDPNGIPWRLRKAWKEVKLRRKNGQYRLMPIPEPQLEHIRDINPNAVVGRSFDQILKLIKTRKSAVWATVAADVYVNVLFYFPDLQWTDFPPSKFLRPSAKYDEAENTYDLTQWKPGMTDFKPTTGTLEPRASGDWNRPRWQALRCQLKEYDSFDDATKPWYETTNGEVPGVMMLDVAGKNAAWATLTPNSYQQRWVLPDGRRCMSLLDTNLSIPQRMFGAFRIMGADFMDDFLIACDIGCRLARVMAKLVDEEDVSAEKVKQLVTSEPPSGILDVKNDFLNCMREHEMGSWTTVWELPPSCGVLKEHLTLIEDSLMRNWFEVAVEAEMDIDLWKYKRKDPKCKPDNEGGIRNYFRKELLEMADKTSSDLMDTFKANMYGSVNTMLVTLFGGESSDKAQPLVDAMFPDLKSMCVQTADTLNADLIGIQGEMKSVDLTSMTEEKMKAQLEEWREREKVPLNDRRRDLWERLTEVVETAHKEPTPTNIQHCATACRIPHRVERYFFMFRFLCVFPMQTPEKPRRKPKQCVLVIWPEGFPNLKQEVPMEPLSLPNGGKDQATEEATQLMEKMTPGSNKIGDNADEDPRVNWGPYPDNNFRGFTCKHEIAIDIPYSVQFQMDGRTFLEPDLPITKKDEEKYVYYRRFTFYAKTRPYTINPLKHLGVAI